MSQTNQLFPTDTIEWANEDVKLSTLPPDSVLPGKGPDKAFIDSIAEWGVLQPVVLVKTPNRGPMMFHVVAGRRRIKAARAAGHAWIPARIAGSEALPYLSALALIENEQRSDNLAADLEAIEHLIHQGFTEDHIAKAVGISKTVLRARMKLLNLNPVLRDGFLKGLITGTVATRAAKLSLDKQHYLEECLRDKGKVIEADIKEVMSAASLQAVAMLPDILFQTPAQEVTDWKIEVAALIERAQQIVVRVPEEPTDPHGVGLLRHLRTNLSEMLDLLTEEGGDAAKVA